MAHKTKSKLPARSNRYRTHNATKGKASTMKKKTGKMGYKKK